MDQVTYWSTHCQNRRWNAGQDTRRSEDCFLLCSIKWFQSSFLLQFYMYERLASSIRRESISTSFANAGGHSAQKTRCSINIFPRITSWRLSPWERFLLSMYRVFACFAARLIKSPFRRYYRIFYAPRRARFASIFLTYARIHYSHWSWRGCAKKYLPHPFSKFSPFVLITESFPFKVIQDLPWKSIHSNTCM